MFGRPALTMNAVGILLRKRGLQAEIQIGQLPGQVGRIAVTDNGVNYFINFLSSSDQFGSVGFLTLLENVDERSLREVNLFNERMRATKITVVDRNVVLTHDFVLGASGLPEEFLIANLSFWNFAMAQFGQWFTSKVEN